MLDRSTVGIFWRRTVTLTFKTGKLTKHVRHLDPLFISLIRMRSKRDIKMGRLCTPGDAVLGIVGGGVTFRFFKW